MKALLVTTALFSGLVSGLLYAYCCSVNIAFRSLSNAEYVRAMQSINTAIQNPAFFVPFIGLLLLFPATALQAYVRQPASFYLLASAMILYFVGVFGVTMFCNVPLNEQLATFSTLRATEAELAAARQQFEKPWTVFHNVRTLASFLSFGLTVLSVLKKKYKP